MRVIGTAVRTAIAMAIGLVVLGATFAVTPEAGADTTAQSVRIDGTSPGRPFAGVGALSAGASSRLLIDYPPRQRSQILDYLFKPHYGASLQQLKVEIGGDTNSTDGTEPSHERQAGQVDCSRGYEWWLMREAKKRNPHIKLYGLEWGAPGWIGGGAKTVWTQQNIHYLLAWLGCAKRHGLHIDYLGGWNERGFDADWYVDLKQALQAHGYGDVHLVAADSFSWDAVATAMQNNPQFRDAVDIIGDHYPCGHLSSSTRCPSSDKALATAKPLWDSEGGSQPYDTGAAPLAREINRDYVDGRMTAMINWSLIWSVYSGLPYRGSGLMLANEPWSGHYVVGRSIWVMAHTAQFTRIGWRYLDSGSTHIPGGSVVSLRSPDSGDWSSIAETLDADAPQRVTYHINGGLSTGTVHVWATDLGSGDPATWFRQVSNVQPQNGTFSITLKPGYLYSLTTTSGQHHGDAISPPSGPWQLPYRERFDEYPAGSTARYLSDLGGSFQTAPCLAGRGHGGRHDMCLQQNVSAQPVQWNSVDNFPVTVAGDPNTWSNYRVDVDTFLPQAGYVELDGRSLGSRDHTSNELPGYHLRVHSDGGWSLYKENAQGTKTELDGGTTSFAVGDWHHLELKLRGDEITAYVDNHELGKAVDSTYARGQVGLQVSPWVKGQFDNLSVRPERVAGKGPHLGPLHPNPVQITAPGGSAEVRTTVTNPGRMSAHQVSADLQLPQGWQAKATTPAPRRLRGGASAPLAWRITAPVTARPGTYDGTVTVRYKEAGLSWVTNKAVRVDLAIVPQEGMTATATSAQSGYPAGNAIDGDSSTLWHTEWSPDRVYPPQSITLDLGGAYDVRDLLYLPRQDGNSHGIITSYAISVSQDGTSFHQVAAGGWALDQKQKSADFAASDVRYVRLTGVQGGGGYVSAAEINVVGSPAE